MSQLSLVGPAAVGVTAVDIDGRFSVFNPHTGRVLTLNETASDVWRLCDGQADASSITAALALAYGEPADDIRASILSTITLFETEGLLAHPEPAVE